MAQITLNTTGVASNGSLVLQSNGTNTAVIIDTSQNVGVGVTPSAWQTGANLKALQVGIGAAFFSDTNSAYLGQNVFQDSAGTSKYINTNFASKYQQSSSVHSWFTAASGTAGNAITFTQAMTLDASGNLGVGVTSIPSYTRLAVTGTAGAQTDAKQQITISAPTTTAGEGAGIRINAASGAKEAVGIVGVVNNASGNLGSMTFGVYNGGANVPEWMRIANNGIVTMSAYGAGTATFSAAGVISSVSDERWKIKDGVPVDPDAMLNKLEPGYWFYNDEKKETFGVDRQLGFYAQNVNAAIGPEAAPEPEEGKPWGYYDRSVLAVTVMSLQKALATIETLTARITALESA